MLSCNFFLFLFFMCTVTNRYLYILKMASSNDPQYGAKPFWNAEGFTSARFQVAAALQNLQHTVQLQLRKPAHCAE